MLYKLYSVFFHGAWHGMAHIRKVPYFVDSNLNDGPTFHEMTFGHLQFQFNWIVDISRWIQRKYLSSCNDHIRNKYDILFIPVTIPFSGGATYLFFPRLSFFVWEKYSVAVKFSTNLQNNSWDDVVVITNKGISFRECSSKDMGTMRDVNFS